MKNNTLVQAYQDYIKFLENELSITRDFYERLMIQKRIKDYKKLVSQLTTE